MPANQSTSLRVIQCVVLALAVALAPAVLRADTTPPGTVWNAGTDTWYTDANWTNKKPDQNTEAFINNDGTATLYVSGNSASALDLFLGYENSSTGSIDQTAGSLTLETFLCLGHKLGDSGTYTMSGGTLSATEHEMIGHKGDGDFLQDGGSNTTADLVLSGTVDGKGFYSLSGTGKLSATTVYVGMENDGTFDQSGGTNKISGTLYVNYGNDNKWSTYTLSAGTLSANDVYLARYGMGDLNQTGGDLTITNGLQLADWGDGAYRISGGTCTVGGSIFESQGTPATSTLAINGGTLTVNGPEITVTTLSVGDVEGSNGSYTVGEGKTVTVYDNMYVGKDGQGSITQTGGRNDVTNSLYIGANSQGVGGYDLQDGTLTAGTGEYIGYGGGGSITHTGGTNTVYGHLYLGYLGGDSPADGGYDLSGTGVLDCWQNVFIGRDGVGTFWQDGGEHKVAGTLYMGSSSNYYNSYTLRSGSLDVEGWEYVGLNGSGTFIQFGGTNDTPTLSVGHGAGSSGTYQMGGGTLTANTIYIAYATGGTIKGSFTQTGGTVNANTAVTIAYRPNSNGDYDLQAGTLNTPVLNIGVDGTALFNYGGGQLNAAAVNIGASGSMTFNSWFVDGPVCNSGTVSSSGDLGLASTGHDVIWTMNEGSSLSVRNMTIGETGIADFTQNGGATTVEGFLTLGGGGGGGGGRGTLQLTNGSLETWNERIGYAGSGTVTQSGGVHRVLQDLRIGCSAEAIGHYELSGGYLRVYRDLLVGTPVGDGSLDMKVAADLAEMSVGGDMVLGPLAALAAVPGSTIRMTGPASRVDNNSTDETRLAGLRNLTLVFEGQTTEWATYEVAGCDVGLTDPGFIGNFVLGALCIGGDSPGMVRLIDLFDNGNRSSPEALYVHDLLVGAASTLDLNGLRVYYSGSFVNNGAVIGGMPVPEPGILCLLCLAGPALLRMRRPRPAPTATRLPRAGQ